MIDQQAKLSILSERALLLRVGLRLDMSIQRRIWQLARQLQQDALWSRELEEVVPGPGSLLLALGGESLMDIETLASAVQQDWQHTKDHAARTRLIEIPVYYGGQDGPDLDAVARHCGLSPEEVVRLHSSGTYDVLCIGFQPGFPYLSGLDPRLFCPRRATPRTRVSAGAVGIGGQQTGVYPASSPGGWQIIGRSPLSLFNPQHDQPSLLQAGDRVRFVVARPT